MHEFEQTRIYFRYSETSKVYTDYNGIIDKHLESDNKSKFQGEKSIQKRRIEVDRYDYTSPAYTYGAGYNYNINAQPDTTVDRRVSYGLTLTYSELKVLMVLYITENAIEYFLHYSICWVLDFLQLLELLGQSEHSF